MQSSPMNPGDGPSTQRGRAEAVAVIGRSNLRRRRRPAPALAATLSLVLLIACSLAVHLAAMGVAEAGSSSSQSQSSSKQEQGQSATTTYGTRTPRPPVGSAAAQTNARGTKALKAAASGGGGSGSGLIDQSARKFSPQEYRIAQRLSAEGRRIKSIKETKLQGVKNADALVDGELTEFKSPKPGAKATTVRNIVSASMRGQGQQPNSGQARRIIIDARGSGLKAAEAKQGLNMVRRLQDSSGRLDAVRIIGDGFDFTDTGFK